jgi:hypothetical protein
MDRKTKIPIASLLGHIEVAPEKIFLDLEAGGFCQSTILFTAPFHPIK